MKKIVFTLAMFSIAMIGYAQTPVVQGADGKVGIGTTTPSAKLEVVHETNSGEVSKVGMTVIRNTQISANGTSYDTGIYSRIGSFSIPLGIMDSGYRIGVNASSFAVSNNFAGILKDNVGVWARAGIHVATPGATIKKAIAVKAEVLDNVTGTTIENAYGVFISTNGYKQSNVINRYDLYAGTAAAKNYFAGNVGIGTATPAEKLHIEGNLLLDAFGKGNESGIFFREGFSKSNKYNLSILAYDHNGSSADGLSVNGYDGISFSTGSGTRNERMRINQNGKVGIGTVDPQSKLEVYHSTQRTVQINPQNQLDVTGNSSLTIKEFVPSIEFHDSSSSSADAVAFVNGNRFYIGKKTGTKITSSSLFNVNLNNGNVGIGKANPSEKLEVNGGVKASSFSVNGSSFSSRLTSNLLQFSRDGFSYIDNTNTNGSIAIRTGGTSNIDLLVKSDGKVGIGTIDTGSHRLAVEGSIGAREIKVEATGWSDFVFEKEYKLPTLTQVENHIKEKGHLKDIPSAAEVKKDGFFLGEMDAKLLQKIEELTLYTIEQENKIKSTEDVNKKLLSIIDKLEKRVTKLEKKE